MNEKEYAQYNYMRSNIKRMVKSQLALQPNGEQFAKDNNGLINQLVENQARAILEERGSATTKTEVMVKASTTVTEILKSKFPPGVIMGISTTPNKIMC